MDEAAAGDEAQITKYGRVVARLVPVSGPLAGTARSTASDDDLFSTGEAWELGLRTPLLDMHVQQWRSAEPERLSGRRRKSVGGRSEFPGTRLSGEGTVNVLLSPSSTPVLS